MEFKDRLKEVRTQRGISQRELGEAIGVSHASVAMYESGKRQPGVEMMIIDRYRQAPENIRGAIRQLLGVQS